MIVIPHLEWHVTHNCNLSCEGCNHFTNHGHNWFISLDELKSWFSSWNKKVSPKRLAVLGGEPLLHKDIVEIIKSLKVLLQHKSLSICISYNIVNIEIF